MKSFSKQIKEIGKTNNKEDDILFQKNHLKVCQNENGWINVEEKDCVCCIIYLIEENRFIIREEYIPTFKSRDKDEYYLTALSGSVESNEDYNGALLREIEEEAGIVIDPDYKIEFLPPLFVSKGNSSKYFPSIITLAENQYHEVRANGDGSEWENKSRTLKIDIKYLNSIQSKDLITNYLLEKFKEYLNIK